MGAEVCTSRPIQKLYLDFLGKYPRSRKSNAYILIVLDHFTKFVWLKTMPKATSAATIKFLREELFNTFGVPEIVHTDNGKQFTTKEFEEMVSHFGITHTRTAAYSPQANASERVNQSILTAIRTHVGEITARRYNTDQDRRIMRPVCKNMYELENYMDPIGSFPRQDLKQ
ncbi:uncharacterized protein K02A2.6-like [Drosophila willistoni]|uniref:uncharacterized protein K02A2.6-like n=1 Tax=Drosophila willistoni TaxID=7260 RepID=UPI001F073CCB|nr:uncharacterized protein K02A2.6-like [Drosophila willistoni]